jgi:S-adenosylmethionine hydrolase
MYALAVISIRIVMTYGTVDRGQLFHMREILYAVEIDVAKGTAHFGLSMDGEAESVPIDVEGSYAPFPEIDVSMTIEANFDFF